MTKSGKVFVCTNSYDDILEKGLQIKLAHFPGWHLGKKGVTRYIYSMEGRTRNVHIIHDSKDPCVNLLAMHFYMNGAIDATKTPCSKALYIDVEGLAKVLAGKQ